QKAGSRRLGNVEAGELLTRFVRTGHQALAFTRSRRGAEIVAQYARRRLDDVEPGLGSSVAAYRGGYLPEERRALERSLTSGELRGVGSTNPLEPGIGGGAVDAVVLHGLPG